jgi:hypothetical protein
MVKDSHGQPTAAEKEEDKRRFRRTREYGPQKLTVAFKVGANSSGQLEGKLYDFSEGGLGMDIGRPFESGEIVEINGELKGSAYSMHLVAKARVVYCRRIDSRSYRIGVAFLEHSYRPMFGQP